MRAIQPGIYRLSLRFLWLPADAEEATQEILIKVCTRLASFRGDSAFKTWVHRVAANHLISMKRGHTEQRSKSFNDYAAAITNCPDEPIDESASANVEAAVLAEESRAACVSGALLCLDRAQRIAFILGGILGFTSTEAALILQISPANFRQRLSRARSDLQQFMAGQCGLVDPANPCRCTKKTRAFIRFGIVDPERLQFNSARRRLVESEVQRVTQGEDGWQRLFAFDGNEPVPDFAGVIEHALGGHFHQ